MRGWPEEVIAWLRENVPGRTVKSGYCTYPVVKLNVEKIGEYLEVA